MSKIIKVLLVSCLVCLGSGVYAQRIGIKAGIKVSSAKVKSNFQGYSFDVNSMSGFQGGLATELDITSHFGINVSLLYAQNRLNVKSGYSSIQGVTHNYIFNNFELPINLRYTLNLPIVKPFLQAGGYYAYTFHAKYKDGGEKIELGSDGSFLRNDYGLNFGVGLNLWSFQFLYNYGLGLAELSPEKQQNQTGQGYESFKNRSNSISIVWFFIK